jgi:hypothetical protein
VTDPSNCHCVAAVARFAEIDMNAEWRVIHTFEPE